MKKQYKILIVLSVFFISAYIATTLLTKPLPIKHDELCLIYNNNSFAYDIKAQTNIELSLNAFTQAKEIKTKKINTKLSAKLFIVTKNNQNNKTTLKAKLDNTEYIINNHSDSLKTKQLSEPFQFDITPSCLVSNFKFEKNTPYNDAQILKSLIQEMQVSLSKENSKKWKTVENNELGSYEALYTLKKSNKNHITLQKNKTHYTNIKNPVPNTKMSSNIILSQHEININPEKPWLESLSGTEEIIILTNDTPLIKSKTKIELVNTVFNNKAFAEQKKQTLINFNKLNKNKTTSTEDQKNISFNTALTDFNTLLTSNDPAQRKQGLNQMVNFLNQSPNNANKLTQAILNKTIAPDLHSKAFLALELCGSPEAQNALIDVMQNDAFDKMNRIRSMIALQDVTDPTPEVITALTEQVQNLDSNDDIASTAALSLGALAGKHQDSYPDYLKQVSNTLKTSLENTTNPDNAATLLLSIGNTRNPELSPVITNEFYNGSNSVRSSAALALGSIQTPENQNTLSTSLNTETNSDVKLSTMRALNKYKTPSTTSVNQVASKIVSEQDHLVRAEMITFLGKQANTNDKAKETLVNLQETETNNHNLELIGKYL